MNSAHVAAIHDLYELSEGLRRSHEEELRGKRSIWRGSPFEWLQRAPNAAKHAYCKQLVTQWLEQHVGCKVEPETRRASYLKVGRFSVSLKTSFLWAEEEAYMFQQIRKEDYDRLLCFGIAPTTAHLWFIPRDELHLFQTAQHANASGVANYLLRVNPTAPSRWLWPYGGEAAEGLHAIATALEGP